MKLLLRTLLSLAVAVILIALLLEWSGADLPGIRETLGALDPKVYWTATGVHASIYVLRAIRFQVLLPKAGRPTLARTIPVAAAHNFAAYVVPAKVGEASLVLYLRRFCGVPASTGLAVLVVSRLLDFAALTGCLAAACLFLGAGAPGRAWLLGVGIALVPIAVGFFVLAARGDRLVSIATGLTRILRLHRTRIGSWLVEAAERLRQALRDVRGSRLVLGALSSLPVWICIFLFYGFLARGFGMDRIGYAESVFGSGLASFAALIPVSVFAAFGTQDAGWVLGFTALGVPAGIATETAIAAHLVYLVNLSAFGLIGHLFMGLLPRAR